MTKVEEPGADPQLAPTPDAQGPLREPPPRLGRFVLLAPIGAGGMGAVYAAWDLQLERRVAIKVLFHDDRVRSLREAQALARLHHPNVVTVHDVGTSGGFDFIAMELVEGMSLRGWLREPRSWRAVLDVFRQAGRGLAAAHAAGLVHRDFKPENVLIGKDGGVWVADFGLARATSGDGDEPAAAREPRAKLLESPLTVTGGLVGTPRYMAPEQHGAARPDPRVDQYSFAVSLWEALFASHPEDGEAPAGRGGAAGRVPGWLRAVVKRGLAHDPEARYPSMDAFVAALGRHASRSGLIALAAVTIAALAALAVAYGVRSPPPPCRGAEQRLAGVWDADVRRTVRAAFEASGRAYAADTFDRVAAIVDHRTSAWAAMRTDACEATAVRREQSAALLDLRMQCLDRRLAEVRALTEVFARADAAVVDRAVAAVHQLGDLEPCADARALLEAFPAPADPAVRARVVALRDELARADALENAGRYRDAEVLTARVVVDARLLGYLPILGEALSALGTAQANLYEGAAAVASLEDGLRVLAEAKDDKTSAGGWVRLVHVFGVVLSRPADALLLRAAAEAAIARAGGGLRLRANLSSNLGQVLKQLGKLDQALAMQRRTLALQTAALDAGDPMIGGCHNSIGVLLFHLGKLDEARRELDETLAIYGRTLGPEHPNVAGVLINLANIDQARGSTGDAVAELERARIIQERTLGLDHPDLGITLGNLGQVHRQRGELDAAREASERSLAILEKRLAPDHLSVASALRRAGQLDVDFGRADAGRARIERALAIYRAKLDGHDQRVGTALTSLGMAQAALGKLDEAGDTLARALAILEGDVTDDAGQVVSELARLRLRRGRADEALPLVDRALAIYAQLGGERDPRYGAALAAKGDVLLALRRGEEALPLFERAQAILVAGAGSPLDLAIARFGLARAVAGKDAARSRQLALQARATLAAAGQPAALELARVDAWLKQR